MKRNTRVLCCTASCKKKKKENSVSSDCLITLSSFPVKKKTNKINKQVDDGKIKIKCLLCVKLSTDPAVQGIVLRIFTVRNLSHSKHWEKSMLLNIRGDTFLLKRNKYIYLEKKTKTTTLQPVDLSEVELCNNLVENLLVENTGEISQITSLSVTDEDRLFFGHLLFKILNVCVCILRCTAFKSAWVLTISIQVCCTFQMNSDFFQTLYGATQ